jgi:nucleotide sugar dehydrogenase
MKVCVIGLGKIGLPLAVQIAKSGFQVDGVDIDVATVTKINLGIEPFPEEMYLEQFLKEVVSEGKLRASSESNEAISTSQVILVAVPLVVDESGLPEFTSLDQVTQQIACSISKGTLVVYETTLPIGTTRMRFSKKIEELSKLRVGTDFNLVFSPERVLTGRIFSDLRRYPKLVGGVTQACTKRGVDFYSAIIDFVPREDLEEPNGVWAMSSCEEAEFVKLAETTYRDVNIGLANQFAKHADNLGIDIYKIIKSANSQPYSHIHQPGISVGGHCIPIYPKFYLLNDPNATIVSAARNTNDGMPDYYVRKLEEELGSLIGLSILVLGVSYRSNVKETAFSGAYDLKRLLQERGASAFFCDPLYTGEELSILGFDSDYRNDRVSAVILHTSHREFLSWDFKEFPNLKSIIDGRNFLDQTRDRNLN